MACTPPVNNKTPPTIQAVAVANSQLIIATIFQLAIGHCFNANYSDCFRPAANDYTTCPCIDIPQPTPTTLPYTTATSSHQNPCHIPLPHDNGGQTDTPTGSRVPSQHIHLKRGHLTSMPVPSGHKQFPPPPPSGAQARSSMSFIITYLEQCPKLQDAWANISHMIHAIM